MPTEKKVRAAVDWEKMEPEWRANIKPVLQLSKEYGVSRAAIIKHWKKEGVERDLSEKIHAKAEALVTQAVVTQEVTSETKVTDSLTVAVNAKVVADAVLNERADVKRARNIVNKLFEEVEAQCDDKEAFRKLGEIMAAPDENGKDRLNDLYHAAISLPERIKGAKALSDALKTLVELERKVLRIDTMPDDPVGAAAKGAAEGAAAGVSQSSRSLLADLMGELGKDETSAA